MPGQPLSLLQRRIWVLGWVLVLGRFCLVHSYPVGLRTYVVLLLCVRMWMERLMECASQKGRPSQLTLSPSDSQLGANVKAVSGDVTSTGGDDRDVMSEVHLPPISSLYTYHTNYSSIYTG